MTEKEEKRSSSMSGGLKNLFYSPSPDDIAVVPPDQNMLPAPRPRQRTPMRSSRESLTDTTNTNSSAVDADFLGVHMVCQVETLSDFFLKQCELTVELCIYNAGVCVDLGQKDKADTWSLLGQTVENMGRDLHNNFDGWGGPGGGALGKEVVAGILQYYELHGDVQMLATIVCVLSGGVGRHAIRDEDQRSLKDASNAYVRNLLPEDDRRLDSYITRYAAILYQWGKITTRAELNKHLAQSLHENSKNQVLGGEVLVPIGPGDEGRLQKDFVAPSEASPDSPGVTFAPMCPRCQKPANPETNVCEE